MQLKIITNRFGQIIFEITQKNLSRAIAFAAKQPSLFITIDAK